MTYPLCPVVGDEALGDEVIVRYNVRTQMAQVSENERLRFVSAMLCVGEQHVGDMPAVAMAALTREVFPDDGVGRQAAVDEINGMLRQQSLDRRSQSCRTGQNLQREVDMGDRPPSEYVAGKEQNAKNYAKDSPYF